MKKTYCIGCLLASFLGSAPASAELTQIVIETTTAERGGVSFGNVGPYERLRGYAVGELDPSDRHNSGIVNIDKAPLNANGLVEYRIDVEILKPVNLHKGNGWLFYDVVNRGNKIAPGFIDADTDYLMNEGYTFVWSGWQGDVAPGGTRLTATFPVATDGGDLIVGMSRDEFINNQLAGDAPGDDEPLPPLAPTFTGNLSYPAANMDKSQATLTVRENEQDPRQIPPGLDFSYLSDSQIEITRAMDDQFDGGAIYEFVYPAKNPTVMGIGFAATRDLNSFLMFDRDDSVGNRNPLASSHRHRPLRHSMAFGLSQSGRFLRDLIYQGYNEDEHGRQIFEGAMPLIAGSRKTFTNYEFAQPGRFSRQHEDHVYPGDQFPFSYATLRDPLTGHKDSVLRRCNWSHTCPKIMHIDSQLELWQARGSLVVTDGNPAGPRDIRLPWNVRVYQMSSAQHTPAGSPSMGICQQLSNPLNYRPMLRALVAAMNQWVARDRTPPPSRYGSVRRGTLVPSDQSSTGFPDIPGVTYNGLFNELTVNDHSVEPPIQGDAYGVLVPAVDADGNGIDGIRHPMLQVPVATHTGWNLRARGQAEDELCSLTGSFIPFAVTKREAKQSGDPRRSIEKRYESKEQYVHLVEKAARELYKERFLLEDDIQRIVDEAGGSEVEFPEFDGDGHYPGHHRFGKHKRFGGHHSWWGHR